MAHKARKRFGQNFLHDPGIITRIVTEINPKPGQNLVEIGPGKGAITCELLKKCRKMHAIELDRDLLEPLASRCAPIGELDLHSSDALKFDFHGLADGQPLRAVGNLPYNISTPLLFHLLDHADVISDMHFMLQKEVVDRMSAPPGSKTYGRLSVMVQIRCKVTPLFDIRPGAFNPPPKIMSSLVRLIPQDTAHTLDNPGLFAVLVRNAFAQRRKTLRNALKKSVPVDLFGLADIDPGLRAEQLSPADYARLANIVDKQSDAG